MSITQGIMRRSLVATFVHGTIVAIMGSSACFVDDPACPGQCFEYTVEYDVPKTCLTAMFDGIDISFTGTSPAGYRGRICFNSTSVPRVVQAIDHLRGGGLLSELDPETQSAYLTTVNTVRADLEAECITAAPGQCINAAEVCSVVGSDMYAELVIDQICVLALDGTEPAPLGPGQVCEPLADSVADSDGTTAHCLELPPASDDGLDDTTSSDGADETSG